MFDICSLWDKYGIKTIIDIRNMKKDGGETTQREHKKIKNVTYDYKGTIFCHCPRTAEIRRIAYSGFEKEQV